MTKANTIKKNWEFQEIINTKRQIVSKHLIIYYRPSKMFKVGISIPKQFANAVYRNHYKNQIRAILRSMDVNKINYETVIIARKTFFELDFQNKSIEITKLYERILDGKK
ncbi:ribonuclease P protein component [Metamycoplasma cloacale]|uniref:Ribonuclease P protein component n=1 Tax=Metamycoplasma cloacale TaxID=92401 RepID=A0A2Z4LLN7_9BACT|nr:ribonuclease P protein component [Metamycoplasma cloacale]AWX42625.1 ribonuclease P protein component [Metamycoplasma cloacale]VEU79612.1 ribonuclease P protein component [Metamycoplasma cloacale]